MGEYVTLAELAKTAGTEVDRNVIDEFAKSNYILNTIPFHQAAAQTGNGGSFDYTYTRLVTNPTAAFRAINADYTASTSEVSQHTVSCKVLGGKFSVDRVIGSVDNTQVALQIAQKVKGATALFADSVINGDSDAVTGDVRAFDGLSVALTGSDTEVDGSAVDWSLVDTQAEAWVALDAVDELLSLVDGSDNVALLVNTKTKLRLQSIARMAGYQTHSEDAAGRKIASYAGVPIVDLGAKPGSNDPVIPVTAGASDIYVARFATDGFHAVAPAGAPTVKAYLPVFNGGSATADGAVEIVATVALKATKAAAVLRGVTIQAGS